MGCLSMCGWESFWYVPNFHSYCAGVFSDECLVDFTGFHEVHMTGLSDTLKTKGKLVNKSSVPYSIGD